MRRSFRICEVYAGLQVAQSPGIWEPHEEQQRHYAIKVPSLPSSPADSHSGGSTTTPVRMPRFARLCSCARMASACSARLVHPGTQCAVWVSRGRKSERGRKDTGTMGMAKGYDYDGALRFPLMPRSHDVAWRYVFDWAIAGEALHCVPGDLVSSLGPGHALLRSGSTASDTARSAWISTPKYWVSPMIA